MDFKDKVVLITGASSGIGKETAIQFAKRSANVVLVARGKDRLIQTENELKKFNVSILTHQCDVSKEDQVQEMAKKVFEKFDTVDILVNNAGFAIYGSVSDLSIDDIKSQMETNYFGMIYCVKNFLPKMIDQKSGHIVNVASVAASFGLPGIASYCASKFAMLGFSEGLKHELKDTGVGITIISPIMVRTNFFDNPSFDKMPKNYSRSISSEKVAEAILNATNSSRFEIIVPSYVRGAVWLKHTFPNLINPLMGKSFNKLLDSSKKE